MKHFQFAPARACGGEQLDVVKGGRVTGWTFEDVRIAALVHAQVCGEHRTTVVSKAIMGDISGRIDPKHYSDLIARYTYEIAKRPHILAAARDAQLERKSPDEPA